MQLQEMHVPVVEHRRCGVVVDLDDALAAGVGDEVRARRIVFVLADDAEAEVFHVPICDGGRIIHLPRDVFDGN
jgi:hypothetical protein